MTRHPLNLKVNGEWKKYSCVACICIYDNIHRKDLQHDEPVLYFQQRRKSKGSFIVREHAIPLSQITYMSY